MKKTLLLTAFCITASFTVFSQVTYLADTAFTTDAGFGGAPASCKAPHERYLGWVMDRTEGEWLADAFTIPDGDGWTFDTVIVYGIQRNSGLTSAFVSCNLQIYDDAPGLGGTVIYGDTSTNLLSSSGFTGIYSVDTVSSIGALLDTEYPIMYLKLYLPTAAHLSAGTYWLSWSATGSSSNPNKPFSPDKVLPGRINPPGQVARQRQGSTGLWNHITDSSNAIGMNMVIKAKAGLASVVTINSNPLNTLSQNTPNPASGVTNISFYMQEDGYARLAVYNTLGQLTRTLTDGNSFAGNHVIPFAVSDLPEGVYYYRLSTATGTTTKKMQVVH